MTTTTRTMPDAAIMPLDAVDASIIVGPGTRGWRDGTDPAACAAVVVYPAADYAAVAVVVDMDHGIPAWENPANEPMTTAYYVSAIVTLAAAERVMSDTDPRG